MSENNKIFYDIHCHAFNLSHAGLLAFLNRFFLNNALSFRDLLEARFPRILMKLIQCQKARTKCWIRRFFGFLFFAFLLLLLGLLINPALLGIDISTLNSIQKVFIRGLLVLILLLSIFLVVLIIYRSKKKGISEKIKNTINLLSLMENDIGRQFLLLEMDILSGNQDENTDELVKKTIENHDNRDIIDQLRKEWDTLGDKSIRIDGEYINKVVLTPLMMDFNYKDFDSLKDIHYNLPPRKPIIDQVVDLCTGMKDYGEKSVFHILEIFPFLGMNPKNYELGVVENVELSSSYLGGLKDKICYLKDCKKLSLVKKLDETERERLISLTIDEDAKEKIQEMIHDFDTQGFDRRNCITKMLHKYFGDYQPRYRNFERSFKNRFPNARGSKDKEKDQKISGYFFSGIKVYPPLGFDPWPEDNPAVFEKVDYLYQFCCEKKIPITTHCSDSGFMVIEKKDSWNYTSPTRWTNVLHKYPDLKLNFAHFGAQSYIKNDEWFREIIELIIEYENVYADFSYRGVSQKFYVELFERISAYPINKLKKIKEHILFGSDFLINLIEAESYSEYLEKFFSTSSFSHADKIQFYTTNPERFLFG